MAAFNKFQSFVEAQAEKLHNLGSDQLAVAFTAAANAPVNTNTAIANLTQISYTNLATSLLLTTTSSAQTSGTYKLILSDLTVTASGGALATFRYVVLYNFTTPTGLLIGWWDIGRNVTLNDTDALLIDFSQVNGVLQVA